jgi:hypothetical protein
LACVARQQRANVLRKAETVIDSAAGRELSAAELSLIEELSREAELLDDRARRFERVAFEERSTSEVRPVGSGYGAGPTGRQLKRRG